MHFPERSVGPAAAQAGGEAGYLLAWQSFVLGFWGTREKSGESDCPPPLSLSPMLSVGERTPRVLTELPQWCLGYCQSGQCLPSTPGRGGYLVSLKGQMGVLQKSVNQFRPVWRLNKCIQKSKTFLFVCDSKRSYTEKCTPSMCTYY